jgi:hypothetical protein
MNNHESNRALDEAATRMAAAKAGVQPAGRTTSVYVSFIARDVHVPEGPNWRDDLAEVLKSLMREFCSCHEEYDFEWTADDAGPPYVEWIG